MVKVRTSQTCYVGGRLREAGSEFEYDGSPTFYMSLVEEEKPVEEAPASPAPSQPFGKKAKKSSKKD